MTPVLRIIGVLMITYSVILLCPALYGVHQIIVSRKIPCPHLPRFICSFTCQCAAVMLRSTYVMDYFLSDNYAATVYPFCKVTCFSCILSVFICRYLGSVLGPASSMLEPYSFYCLSLCL